MSFAQSSQFYSHSGASYSVMSGFKIENTLIFVCSMKVFPLYLLAHYIRCDFVSSFLFCCCWRTFFCCKLDSRLWTGVRSVRAISRKRPINPFERNKRKLKDHLQWKQTIRGTRKMTKKSWCCVQCALCEKSSISRMKMMRTKKSNNTTSVY